MIAERLAKRLGLLDGVSLSQDDIELIVAEFENFEQALQELEAFAEGAPWPWLPVQP